MRRLIRRTRGLSAADWRALVTALAELARARLWMARVPAGEIVRDLKARSEARGPDTGPPDDRRVASLSWALAAVGARVPWRSDCLVQVLAAERVLTRWGRAPAFYLGVSRNARDGLAAHVWLQLGDEVVTGGPVSDLDVMIGDRAR